MKKKIIFFIVIVLIIGGVFAYIQRDELPLSAGKKVSNNVTIKPAIDINYTNLASFLSENAIIKDLPEDAKLILKFYNYDSGEREWEKSFVLAKENVYEGSVDNPDLVIMLHSKYLDELNSRNFCSIITKAGQNGDLGYESELNSVELLWKFKSLNKHKSCLGL